MPEEEEKAERVLEEEERAGLRTSDKTGVKAVFLFYPGQTFRRGP